MVIALKSYVCVSLCIIDIKFAKQCDNRTKFFFLFKIRVFLRFCQKKHFISLTDRLLPLNYGSDCHSRCIFFPYFMVFFLLHFVPWLPVLRRPCSYSCCRILSFRPYFNWCRFRLCVILTFNKQNMATHKTRLSSIASSYGLNVIYWRWLSSICIHGRF